MIICTNERSEPSSPATHGELARNVAWHGYLRRISDGDQSAIAALYDESKSMVYGLACRVLRVPSDAEEVTLDVYLQVWRTALSYDPRRGSVVAWLLTIARSRAIDRLRATAGTTSLSDPLNDRREPVAPDLDPEMASLARSERVRIRSALMALSPDQRRAIELAFFRGLTHRELAVHFGVPLGTIKTRIRTGMSKLRDLLDDTPVGVALGF